MIPRTMPRVLFISLTLMWSVGCGAGESDSPDGVGGEPADTLEGSRAMDTAGDANLDAGSGTDGNGDAIKGADAQPEQDTSADAGTARPMDAAPAQDAGQATDVVPIEDVGKELDTAEVMDAAVAPPNPNDKTGIHSILTSAGSWAGMISTSSNGDIYPAEMGQITILPGGGVSFHGSVFAGADPFYDVVQSLSLHEDGTEVTFSAQGWTAQIPGGASSEFVDGQATWTVEWALPDSGVFKLQGHHHPSPDPNVYYVVEMSPVG